MRATPAEIRVAILRPIMCAHPRPPSRFGASPSSRLSRGEGYPGVMESPEGFRASLTFGEWQADGDGGWLADLAGVAVQEAVPKGATGTRSDVLAVVLRRARQTTKTSEIFERDGHRYT